MGLRLVYDDLDLSLDLPGVPAITEAIGMQIERCLIQGGASGFAWRLVGEITNMLDTDFSLRPPPADDDRDPSGQSLECLPAR